jgi:hypothetical protein
MFREGFSRCATAITRHLLRLRATRFMSFATSAECSPWHEITIANKNYDHNLCHNQKTLYQLTRDKMSAWGVLRTT